MQHVDVTGRGAVARGLGAAAVVAAGLLGASLVAADDTQPSGPALTATRSDRLDDIVVTARKVEENLQQVPVSVTAIGADEIAERHIQGLRDIARHTPGFSFENFTGPLAAPIIRGQTQTRVDLPVQNVASFFNGVYLQRGYTIDASLLDVERVEVIKGPQSALYGRNAFSGAINYITKRPGDALQGRAEITAGNHERLDYKGSISGPLTGWLGVTAAAGHSEQDGTWSNGHPLASQGTGSRDNVGGWEKDAALLGFTLTPLQALSFDGAFSWSDLDVEHMPAYTISGPPGIAASVNSLNCSPLPSVLAGSPLPGSTQNRLYCGELRPDVRLVPADTATTPVQPSELAGPSARPPGVVIDPRAFSQRGISRLASLKGQWDATGQLAFIYLGGHTNTDVQSRGSPGRNPTASSNDFAAGPFVPLNGLIVFDSQPNGGFWSYSHELRAEWHPGGLVRRAMLGAFSSRSRDDLSQWSQWGVPNSLAPPVQTLTLANNTRRDEVDSVFGLVTLDVTERIAVTAEARYTKEGLTLQVRTAPGIPLPSPFDSSAPIVRAQSSDFDYVTPRLSVDYRPTETTMVYGLVGKGVKSGGLNAPGRDPAQDSYEPEENWTFELGSKNDLLDGTLRLNVAAYYIDWTRLQGSVARNYPDATRPDCVTACVHPAPGTPVGVIVGNLGNASVYGVEVSGAWRATQAIAVDYGFAYQAAVYDDDQISQRAANSGNCDGVVCVATVRDARGRPIDGARIGGNQLERQPRIQAALGAELTFAPAGLLGFDWSTRADLTYQAKQYVDELNLAWVPARTLLDASLNATRGPLYVRLWAKNLTDEQYVTTSLFVIGTGGGRDASYVPLLGERRTFGLTVGLRY